MALNVENKISSLDLGRRRKVEERAAELIAEEKTLRKSRKGNATHPDVARTVRTKQRH